MNWYRIRHGKQRQTLINAASAALLVFGVLSSTAGAASAQTPVQTPVGQAEGLQIRLLSLLSLDFGQTNPLPVGGATQTAGVASVNVLGLASTGVITASTTGTPLSNVTTVTSTATVDGLTLIPAVFGDPLLRAGAVSSTTTAGPSSSAGSSTIANLTFGGQNVVVTGAVNQTVEITGVARLVINEQSVTGNVRTTNALHLTVLSGLNAGDIYVAQSQAGFSGSTAVAPEPGSIALLLTAGIPIVGIVRRRSKKH